MSLQETSLQVAPKSDATAMPPPQQKQQEQQQQPPPPQEEQVQKPQPAAPCVSQPAPPAPKLGVGRMVTVHCSDGSVSVFPKLLGYQALFALDVRRPQKLEQGPCRLDMYCVSYPKSVFVALNEEAVTMFPGEGAARLLAESGVQALRTLIEMANVVNKCYEKDHGFPNVTAMNRLLRLTVTRATVTPRKTEDVVDIEVAGLGCLWQKNPGARVGHVPPSATSSLLLLLDSSAPKPVSPLAAKKNNDKKKKSNNNNNDEPEAGIGRYINNVRLHVSDDPATGQVGLKVIWEFPYEMDEFVDVALTVCCTFDDPIEGSPRLVQHKLEKCPALFSPVTRTARAAACFPPHCEEGELFAVVERPSDVQGFPRTKIAFNGDISAVVGKNPNEAGIGGDAVDDDEEEEDGDEKPLPGEFDDFMADDDDDDDSSSSSSSGSESESDDDDEDKLSEVRDMREKRTKPAIKTVPRGTPKKPSPKKKETVVLPPPPATAVTKGVVDVKFNDKEIEQAERKLSSAKDRAAKSQKRSLPESDDDDDELFNTKLSEQVLPKKKKQKIKEEDDKEVAKQPAVTSGKVDDKVKEEKKQEKKKKEEEKEKIKEEESKGTESVVVRRKHRDRASQERQQEEKTKPEQNEEMLDADTDEKKTRHRHHRSGHHRSGHHHHHRPGHHHHRHKDEDDGEERQRSPSRHREKNEKSHKSHKVDKDGDK